nr:AraC family transcriptional regulator [Trinickia dinghuensis]
MGGSTIPAIIRASTESVDSSDRLAFWDSYSSEELIGLRTSASLDGDFAARLAGCALGELKVFEIEGSVHCVERNHECVERFPKGSVFLCHLISGSAYFIQKGKVFQLEAGDAIVYDAGKPFTYGFATPMHQFLIDLPVDLADRRWGVDPDALPLKLAPSGALDFAVRAELSRSCSRVLRAPTPEFVSSFSDQTNFVLRSIIASETGGRSNLNRSIFYLIDAKRYIAQNLSCADLNPTSVAEKLGLSSRHLNRLFGAEGGSVSDYIWEKRAEKAWRDLRDGAMSHLTISEISFRCGYASPAHFTRTMVERYGMRPSDIRKAARTRVVS